MSYDPADTPAARFDRYLAEAERDPGLEVAIDWEIARLQWEERSFAAY